MLEEEPLPPDLPPTRLGDVLPFDDPNSPWLYRLMLLRDDIDLEVRSLALEASDEPIKAWRTVYFLRRLSVSIDEVNSLWARHIGKIVKKSKLASETKAELVRIGKVISETAGKLEVVRNSLGGHVRISNADPDKPRRRPRLLRRLMKLCWWLPDWEEDRFERRMLKEFADWTGPMLLDLKNRRRTNFRGITVTSLFFATGTHDLAAAMAWHSNLSVLKACGDILAAIDGLLYMHVTKMLR
jgi:hypothetical protein